MNPAESNRTWKRLIVLLLAAALGCQSASVEAPASGEAAGPVSVDAEIEFGPGSLNLEDMRIGLDQVASYESKLTLSFEGSDAGQPEQWSGTYTYRGVNSPAARQLTIAAPDEAGQSKIWMAELEGVAYQRKGEEVCMGFLADTVNPSIRDLEPAAQLASVFGAEEVGTEDLNGVQAVHYVFDERALAELGLNKSAGELWLTTEGGYVLRYKLSTTGDESYFGEGMQGVMSWDYELTQVDQPLTIELPVDCPPGLINAPLLSDAVDAERLPGATLYSTATSVAEVQAFYEEQLPKLGWTALSSGEFELPEGISAEEYQQALEYMQAMGIGQPTPTPNPDLASLIFQQGDQTLRVNLTRTEGTTDVVLLLSTEIPE